MEFYSEEVKKEYIRLSNLYPDVEEYAHPLINVSDTLRAYFALADYFTDPSSDCSETMLVGLRSADLLYSALSRQCVCFNGRKKYTEPIDICSTLFYGMVKNHSFSDGNKRTALLTLLYQLNLYGYYPNSTKKSFEKLVVAVAANELPELLRELWRKFKDKEDAEVKAISYLLRRMTKKKDHSYHLTITMKDMDQALQNYGVSSSISSGKIHFTRTFPRHFWGQRQSLKYTMVFGGWTRSIGAQKAKEILTNLELYEQFPDYQSFIDGQEPLYRLIEDFEEPLRRLKDE